MIRWKLFKDMREENLRDHYLYNMGLRNNTKQLKEQKRLTEILISRSKVYEE